MSGLSRKSLLPITMSEHTEVEQQQLDEAADRDPDTPEVSDRLQKLIDRESVKMSIGCWVVIIALVGGVGLVLVWPL